jgi:hypothetical protein
MYVHSARHLRLQSVRKCRQHRSLQPQNMNSSSINIIFKALSFTDLFVLVFYSVDLTRISDSAHTPFSLTVGSLPIFRPAAIRLTTAFTYWRCVEFVDPLRNKYRCHSACIVRVYSEEEERQMDSKT